MPVAWLQHRRLFGLLAALVVLAIAIIQRRSKRQQRRAGAGALEVPPYSPTALTASPTASSPQTATGGFRRKQIRVDRLFVRRLVRLLRIGVPRWIGVESLTLSVLTALLLLRTRLTVVIAAVVGENAKHLVNRNAQGFISGVIDLGLWALPSSVVNSGIKYCTALLDQRVRRNLQRHMQNEYLSNHLVYKVCAHHRQAVGGDAEPSSSRAAPERDLARSESPAPAVATPTSLVVASEGFEGSKAARSPRGDRGASGWAIDNPDHRLTEDILAFSTEVTDVFPTVFKPTVDVFTFIYELSKNGGVLPPTLLLGYYFLSGALIRSVMPNFAKLTAQTQQKEGDLRSIHTQLTQHAEEVAFYRGEVIERENANKALDSLVKHQLHVKLMKSVTDFMDAVLIKYGATCMGYAVCSLGVFAAKGKVSTPELTRIYIRSSQLYIPLARAVGKIVMLHKKITALAGYTSRVAELKEVFDHLKQEKIESRGVVREVSRCDAITFKDVDVVAPSGIVLIKGLSLTVRRGQHLLIMGNNGSGKSSLMRCIAGLWPFPNGEIVRPPLQDISFLSQRTYLPTGTFRTQLIYPDTEEDMRCKSVTDAELLELAGSLGLANVIQREGGLDSDKEWHEVFSGGERQRVAMVRVLYHRPQFALLDESSSAVSQEMEPFMYTEAKARGTSLITVSHRDTLKQFHDSVLFLDGMGGYSLRSAKDA